MPFTGTEGSNFMSFLGIEAFLAIVRTKNLSRAATDLCIAQTTISHRLKILEQMVGTSLVKRGKGVKEIELTPAGEKFVKLAERWDSLMRETQVFQLQGSPSSLSVGAVDSLNTCFFPSIYRLISEKQPQLMLQIRTQHSVELYEEIEKRQIDIAFVLRERFLPNVNTEKCFVKPMVVLRLASTTDSEPKLVHPTELDPNHELYIYWGALYQEWHDKWWDPMCPSRIKLDSFHLISSLLHQPRQWAIVPIWVAKNALREKNFSIDRLSPSPPDITCYKITHKYPTSSTIESLNQFAHYLDIALINEPDTRPNAI